MQQDGLTRFCFAFHEMDEIRHAPDPTTELIRRGLVKVGWSGRPKLKADIEHFLAQNYPDHKIWRAWERYCDSWMMGSPDQLKRLLQRILTKIERGES